MGRLQRLFEDQGQSPWLDNLTRDSVNDGTLQAWIDSGIRGVTANPTIFANAIAGSDAYDADLAHLLRSGMSVSDAYWELITADVTGALDLFRPLFDSSGQSDGFVSIEVSPEIAYDTEATISAALELHETIDRPNLMVKIPATEAGIPAIEAVTAAGRSVNITLIFSIARYQQVIDAYMSGLETLLESGGDPSAVHSVASFFVSRVDTEVDNRLEAMGSDEAKDLMGAAAIAQARVAYRLFEDQFSSDRWENLADSGARVQRPLWASTSTKNPDYSDTRYVDELIGPDTVTTLTEGTIAEFEDHGTLARTIDAEGVDPVAIIGRLDDVGIDLDDVGSHLTAVGIEGFAADQDSALEALRTKAEAA